MEYSFGASQYLSEDPEAQQFHAAALRARFEGRFHAANRAFNEASTRLLDTEVSMDRDVQLARVHRDRGASAMLEAAFTESTIPLADAQTNLQLARAELSSLEGPHNFPGVINAMGQEMFATHAHTVSMVGRLATLSTVMFERDTRGKSQYALYDREVAQKAYGEAHRLFLKGNDGSGRVEHALLGARQERLNGQRLHMLPWLKRAAAGLMWTMRRNPEDLPNAWNAVGRHLPSLRSYKTARDDVLNNP